MIAIYLLVFGASTLQMSLCFTELPSILGFNENNDHDQDPIDRGFLEFDSIQVAEPAITDLAEPAEPDGDFVSPDELVDSKIEEISVTPFPSSADLRSSQTSKLHSALEYIFYSILYCVIQAMLSYMLDKLVPNWHIKIYDLMTCIPRPVRWLVGPMIFILFFSFLTCLVPRLSSVLRGIDPIGRARSYELELLRSENSRLNRALSEVRIRELTV